MKDASRSEFRAILLITALISGYLIIQRITSIRELPETPVVQVMPAAGQKTDQDTANPPGPDHAGQEGQHASDDRQSPSVRNTERQARRTPANHSAQRPRQRAIQCARFDPNTVHRDTLIEWGVPSFVVSNLVKYREKGGSFRSSADIGRIYGMDSTILSALQPCMIFRKASTARTTGTSTLCINAATREDWAALPGIGPVLSERIIKFRNALGGFSSIDQVALTYGLPPETFVSIRSRLKRSNEHKRIPVNLATTEMLASHPYISRREAQSMINYIRHNGVLRSPEDLRGLHILSAEQIEKVIAYLDFSISEDAIGANTHE
ncbi:MAG: helix-hairpin-helix domain-containing protein [Saprospiraceae bacterium]|nr:helix-hairpin-helix domain-containing protein [Saprospiraceae bacterium]